MENMEINNNTKLTGSNRIIEVAARKQSVDSKQAAPITATSGPTLKPVKQSSLEKSEKKPPTTKPAARSVSEFARKTRRRIMFWDEVKGDDKSTGNGKNKAEIEEKKDDDEEIFIDERNTMEKLRNLEKALNAELEKAGLEPVSNMILSAENFTEEEIDSKFSQLSLAFKTDKLTLNHRQRIEQHQRENCEKDMNNEMKILIDSIDELTNLLTKNLNLTLTVEERACLDEILPRMKKNADIVCQCVKNVIIKSEIIGGIAEEERLFEAFDVILLQVENLTRQRDRERNELKQLKKILSTHNQNGFERATRASFSIGDDRTEVIRTFHRPRRSTSAISISDRAIEKAPNRDLRSKTSLACLTRANSIHESEENWTQTPPSPTKRYLLPLQLENMTEEKSENEMKESNFTTGSLRCIDKTSNFRHLDRVMMTEGALIDEAVMNENQREQDNQLSQSDQDKSLFDLVMAKPINWPLIEEHLVQDFRGLLAHLQNPDTFVMFIIIIASIFTFLAIFTV